MPKNLTSMVLPHGPHWAIEERSARQLWKALESINLELHIAETADEPKAFDDDGSPKAASVREKGYGVTDGVAIISMVGPMMKAPSSMSNAVSTVGVRRQIRDAAADPDVRAIMLRIDSPGGSVSGTADLADDVRQAAKKKPTMAYIEDMGCSAAYWAASQAGSIVANRTAVVGSIGTYAVVEDWSKFYEGMGIGVHIIGTGAYKGAGAQGAPITAEQLAEWQREVNELNSYFLGAVSRGRKMSMSSVKEIADGRVFVGTGAKTLGLVDAIGTFDQAVADLRNSVGNIKAEGDDVFRATLSFAQEDTSLTGMTLLEESRSALAATRGLTSRIRDLRDISARQDRPLSAKATGHITDQLAGLQTLRQEIAAFEEELQALPVAEASSTAEGDDDALADALLLAALAS